MEASQVRFLRSLFAVTLAMVTYLSLMPLPETGLPQGSDKIEHACAFYVLGLLLDFSLPRSAFGLRKFLALMAYGVAIECAQYFLPYREFSLFDMLADAAGLMLYLASVPLLKVTPVLQRRWRTPAG